MSFTLEAFASSLTQVAEPRRWLVAFSGGLDSTVLLHALVALKPSAPILAIHVNHGLSPKAGQWAIHCSGQCEALGVPLVVAEVDVARQGKGLENAARDARYRVFAEQLEAGDVLLLAHQQNDQAETLLFRLMRGAGVPGLAAMAPRRPFGNGLLFRPLLEFCRDELTAFAEVRHLQWIEDESNQQQGFDRNFLRKQVLPLLRERWPAALAQLSAAAARCREADELLQSLAEEDLAALQYRLERWGSSVDWPLLAQLSRSRRFNLIRSWARRAGHSLPEARHREEIERQFFLEQDAAEASRSVEWGDAALRSYQKRLYLTPRDPDFKASPVAWNGKQALNLPDGSRLHLQAGQLDPDGDWQLRWRQGGERCRPLQRAHSQSLKKLLNEYALEPWLRPRVPLLYRGETLVAVGDLWLCADAAQVNGAGELRLRWEL